ncbi:MAG: DNA-directed RNA polymerase subunit K [Nanoarchaeota archaeon]
MDQELEEKYTRYEIARILGARSLQLAMDAPILLKFSKEEMDELNYDVLRIAEKEFEAGVLPITVKRPLPKKSEKEIKKLSNVEIKEKLEIKAEKEKKEASYEKKEEVMEEKEEKEIMEQGEIMEIANPDDEEEVTEEEEKEEI